MPASFDYLSFDSLSFDTNAPVGAGSSGDSAAAIYKFHRDLFERRRRKLVRQRQEEDLLLLAIDDE